MSKQIVLLDSTCRLQYSLFLQPGNKGNNSLSQHIVVDSSKDAKSP